ncbi:hypothetical protein SAMN04488038_104283 [Solimonas aquatica]|uniref:Uncharacterized protein n=1 Tax=Solimonas aquatica TaxID=489703 RepID=A0A1H9E4W1_9GAMM|nr:hypothetical protein [Solimonas aquatica]SEQ20675.1 hypothetical protein SAMN04488038_104283 [Solimonas aquatica]
MSQLDAVLQRGHALWLDYTRYAGDLLAGGRIPWLDATGYVAWQRKAQGLLKSDVLSLDVQQVVLAWLAAHGALREAMAAKRRAVYPLKTLLADEALRAHLQELAAGLRASFAQTPLALVCPTPRLWLLQAYRLAHGDEAQTEIGEDEIDSASLYLADFLRAFGESGLDVLLLGETADSEPAPPAVLALYQSALNVAAHYRWRCALLSPGGRCEDAEGIDLQIAPQPAAKGPAGLLLAADFWDGAPPPACPPGGLRYVEIPAGAQPEAVLQRLATLRG